MLPRVVTAAALVASFVFFSACTTTRAVLAWEKGWQAEAKGEPQTAMARYAEAYGRNDRLVGAELNRIRLLARTPDKHIAASTALDALLKKSGEVPEVAIFGAAWALRDGQPKVAVRRLDAARGGVLKKNPGCPPVMRSFLRADVSAGTQTGAWQAASESIKHLGGRCGAAAVPAAQAALVTWNRGDRAGTARWLARLPAADTSVGLLRALLARLARDHRGAETLLGQVKQPAMQPLVLALRADLALAMGDPARAERLALQALALQPGMLIGEQALGLALLARGDLQRARDLLAGVAARHAVAPPWTVNFDLGLVELRLGRLDQARQRFDAAARGCSKGDCLAAARNRDAMLKLGL